MLSLHYEFFHGDRYIQFNHVHDIYHVLNVLTCQFLAEVVAEFTVFPFILLSLFKILCYRTMA